MSVKQQNNPDALMDGDVPLGFWHCPFCGNENSVMDAECGCDGEADAFDADERAHLHPEMRS